MTACNRIFLAFHVLSLSDTLREPTSYMYTCIAGLLLDTVQQYTESFTRALINDGRGILYKARIRGLQLDEREVFFCFKPRGSVEALYMDIAEATVFSKAFVCQLRL